MCNWTSYLDHNLYRDRLLIFTFPHILSPWPYSPSVCIITVMFFLPGLKWPFNKCIFHFCRGISVALPSGSTCYNLFILTSSDFIHLSNQDKEDPSLQYACSFEPFGVILLLTVILFSLASQRFRAGQMFTSISLSFEGKQEEQSSLLGPNRQHAFRIVPRGI